MATSLRQQANSEQPWLGNACPNPLLRLDAHNGTSPANFSYPRLHVSKARRKCQSITHLAKIAIHSLQLYQPAKASGRSENRAFTFEQCQSGASSRSSYRSTRAHAQRLQLIRARGV